MTRCKNENSFETAKSGYKYKYLQAVILHLAIPNYIFVKRHPTVRKPTPISYNQIQFARKHLFRYCSAMAIYTKFY